MSGSESEEEGYSDIFTEPEGFREAEKQPTFETYQLPDGSVLSLRLIGHSALWGHLLWNAARILASYLTTYASSLVQNKTVLELGAGAGLPSLICATQGASKVVVTDYPDADLVANLQHNIDLNSNAGILSPAASLVAEGYRWGDSCSSLLSHLPSPSHKGEQGFDLLILGDLLFNHSQHLALLDTVRQTLKRSATSQALVFFTPYRPWLLQKDLAFFDLARESGFIVEKVLEEVMDSVMFESDPGDERLRRTVFGYSLRWKP